MRYQMFLLSIYKLQLIRSSVIRTLRTFTAKRRKHIKRVQHTGDIQHYSPRRTDLLNMQQIISTQQQMASAPWTLGSTNGANAAMWLRTGPETHQLTNSHLRPTALEDSVLEKEKSGISP